MVMEKWIIEPGQTRIIDLELVRRLKVGLIGGRVDVIAHDEPGARVEVSSVSGKELAITIDGDALEIDHPQLRWDNFLEVFRGFRDQARAEVSILAPRQVVLKLGVVSGDALISGFDGGAKFSTVSGEVVVDNHDGDIDVSSVSGEISVGNHRGRVRAQTVSGDVIVTGDVEAFHADTVSGDMVVDTVGTPSKIDTNTVSGDLTVRLAAGSGARFRVNTVGGTVVIDDLRFKGVLGKGFEHQVGELAGRWLDLGANSVSGNVSIMRRNPAESTAPTGSSASTDAGATTGSASEPASTDGEASA